MPIFRPSRAIRCSQLIALCNADPRPEKIDVGVGVFRDGAGNTPILKVMKEAEQRLLDTQVTKAYLGSAGDKRFAELLRPILLGQHADDERIAGRSDARRLRRASPRLRADRDGQRRRARVRRNADLAQPSADHPARSAWGSRNILITSAGRARSASRT